MVCHLVEPFIENCQKTCHHFKAPLEKAIRLHLLSLHPPNDSEWALLALPICLQDLGIFDPCKSSEDSYQFQFQSLPLWLMPS